LTCGNSISINTVSGGIVNFGGAFYISPISISKTVTGSGSENTGTDITTNSDPVIPNQDREENKNNRKSP
jgi:hypothetical protein